ncbi:MAG: hypothetical protein WDW38_005811 [Sanguina aurantia]
MYCNTDPKPSHHLKPPAPNPSETQLSPLQSMREREYLPLIPKAERTLIRSFLAAVYAARGCTHEPSPLRDAWSQTMELAAGLGTWTLDFELPQLTNRNLLDLVLLLERRLLGGCLVDHMLTHKRRPLSCRTLRGRGHEGWICVLGGSNCIEVNLEKWGREVSPSEPWDFEGVWCSSRLELLCHALAHELVHAVVLNFWPEMDASTPAYIADSRHGPIFRLLNNQLFGHATTALRPKFPRDPNLPRVAAAAAEAAHSLVLPVFRTVMAMEGGQEQGLLIPGAF